MKVHVFERFPRQTKLICKLQQKNELFQETCANYEEICAWLDTQSHLASHSSLELDRAKELIHDLEKEIINILTKEQR